MDRFCLTVLSDQTRRSGLRPRRVPDFGQQGVVKATTNTGSGPSGGGTLALLSLDFLRTQGTRNQSILRCLDNASQCNVIGRTDDDGGARSVPTPRLGERGGGA